VGLICLDSKTQSLVGLTNAHTWFKDPLIYDNAVDFTVIENDTVLRSKTGDYYPLIK
jgi:hypothetical protein